MTLASLKFDTPNNAATSLAIIADMVRRGEWRVSGAIVEKAEMKLGLVAGQEARR